MANSEIINIGLNALQKSLFPRNTNSLSLNFIPGADFRVNDEWFPGTWTGVLLHGLDTLKQTYINPNRRVIEVGTGTGIVAAYALANNLAQFVLGTDINPAAPAIAEQNVAGLVPEFVRGTFAAVTGDLLNLNLENGVVFEDISTVVACIPQVPNENLNVNSTGQEWGNFYEPGSVSGQLLMAGIAQEEIVHYNNLGLGLNALLLEQAKTLPKCEEVILNLGGRPGKNNLEAMFRNRGYDVETLYEEVIPQDADTDISSLVELELQSQGQIQFEFFADQEGKWKITAREAQEIRNEELRRSAAEGRKAAEVIYHKIYVMRGTPVKNIVETAVDTLQGFLEV